VRTSLARIGIKVVPKLAADLDLIATDVARFKKLTKDGFCPAVAVGIAVVETRDSVIE